MTVAEAVLVSVWAVAVLVVVLVSILLLSAVYLAELFG